jgi:hypothetical protein
MHRAAAFYTAVGKEPVTLTRDLPGYLANRLSAALWREAIPGSNPERAAELVKPVAAKKKAGAKKTGAKKSKAAVARVKSRTKSAASKAKASAQRALRKLIRKAPAKKAKAPVRRKK